MNEIKKYILKLIILIIAVQIGNVFLNKTAYNKLFNSICGVIISLMIVMPVINFVKTCKFTDSNSNFKDANSYVSVKDTFENNLGAIIHDDILNKFNINCKVKVNTDYSSINICIVCNNNINKNEIIAYVKNKYCNVNDAVVMKSE